MNKTTVYLEETSLAALKRLAAEQGRAEAELIREAVVEYVRRAGRPPMRSLGVANGPPDLASRTDELLAAGFASQPQTKSAEARPASRKKVTRARR